MHSQYFILALIAATSAVPLNINLGAYSPALVVGDGEISLGSTESASQLMATLASGAAAGGGGGGGGGEAAPKGVQPAAQPKEPAAPQGQPGNADPKKEGGDGGGGDGKDKPAEMKPAKRSPDLARALERFFGKRAPAPTPAEDQMAAVEAAMQWIKRDLAGFEAALGYAREAQKDQPKIELGTENAGVGILISPGLNVPKDSAAAGEKPKARRRKRAEVVTEESDAPKMTLVAITEV